MGVALEVSDSLLQGLKCRGDPDSRKFIEVLQCWMDRCPDAVSWATIAAALETDYVRRYDVAKEIRKKM